MSQHDNLPETYETNGRNDGRRSDLAVLDQEEYKNKRRLERILDAHDRVEEWDDISMLELTRGEISPMARQIILLRAVKQFIRECFNMLHAHHQSVDGADGYYITEEPLGCIERHNEPDVEFYGLYEVMHAERIYTEEWTETERNRHYKSEQQTKTATYAVPEHVTMEAFLLLKKFLKEERDLDIAFDPDAYEGGDGPGL